MTLRAVLNKYMYHDTVDVYRSESADGLIDDFEQTLIYEKIPCKLSVYGKDISTHRDDVSQKETYDLRLTYSPEYEIKPNDFIRVYRQGQVIELFAGEQFNYYTHAELSCRRRKESGQ